MTEIWELGALASKVDWEGGVLEAIEYGIKPEEVPEGELRELWTKACALHAELEPVLKQIGKILEEGRS